MSGEHEEEEGSTARWPRRQRRRKWFVENVPGASGVENMDRIILRGN